MAHVASGCLFAYAAQAQAQTQKAHSCEREIDQFAAISQSELMRRLEESHGGMPCHAMPCRAITISN